METPDRKPRGAVWLAVALCGANVGVCARFWRAVLTEVPPSTIDWSPAIYWLAGLLIAVLAIGAACRARVVHSPRLGWTLVALNGTALAGYLWIPCWIVWRAWSSLA